MLEDDSTGETVMNSGWCVGHCERTSEKGDFPAETVYVLPALTKPQNDILVSKSFYRTGIAIWLKKQNRHSARKLSYLNNVQLA